MTSLEIAALTGKRHDNVMRDIKRILEDLEEHEGVVGCLLKFEDTHKNRQNGITYPIYRLPKRECLILAAGYSVPLRASIIDRWLELKVRRARPVAAPVSATEVAPEIQTFATTIGDIEVSLRCFKKDGTIWFIAKDVTVSLGYTNGRKAVEDHVPATHKGVTKCDTLGGRQDLTTITEGGLYRLIGASKTELGELFRDWVYDVVLPSIRKHGGYILGQEKPEMTQDELLAKAVLVAHSVIAAKDKTIAAQAAKIDVLEQELNHLSVAEFIALNHRYDTHRYRVKLGKTASDICRTRGIEVVKQIVTGTNKFGFDYVNKVGVYPREIRRLISRHKRGRKELEMNAIVPTTGTLKVHPIEGEPRILDTDLAVKLGFADPAMIRKLIKRRLPELGRLGIISTVSENAGKRGRPSSAHYLNEAQALLIVMKAETKNAEAARAEIIAVFKAYRHGQLVPVAQPSLPDFSNPAAAARAWADEYEEKERLKIESAQKDAVISVMKPKAEAAEALLIAEGTLCWRETAKVLGLLQHDLMEALNHRYDTHRYRPRGIFQVFEEMN